MQTGKLLMRGLGSVRIRWKCGTTLARCFFALLTGKTAYTFPASALVLAGALVASMPGANANEPRYNWSGLYLGGNVGWAGAKVSGDYVTSAAVNHHNVKGSNGAFGLTAGLQHQWGQFVLGAEANYSWLGSEASTGAGTTDCLAVLPATNECRARVNNLFTIGPRIGFAPSNQWLLFATAGYATGNINTKVINLTNGSTLGTSSLGHSGTFIGGGVEYAATQNWILGLEYQHVSLKSGRHFDANYGGCCTVTPETRDMKANVDTLRLRATYKFN